jgi:hypothetical protein
MSAAAGMLAIGAFLLGMVAATIAAAELADWRRRRAEARGWRARAGGQARPSTGSGWAERRRG